MVRIVYSILLIQCFFGQLEASPKRQREEQVHLAYPIRRPIGNRVSHPVIAAQVSHPVIAAQVSDPVIAPEVSQPANILSFYSGPFRMEVRSIIRHMITFFSDTANPMDCSDVNVVHSTQAHIRQNFPASQISEIEVGSAVMRLLSYIVIPNEILTFLDKHSPTTEQVTEVATRLGKRTSFVLTTVLIWTEFRNKGFEPHRSLPGFQILSRSALVSYLRSTLVKMEGSGYDFQNEIPIVMRLSLTHPGASSSDVLSLLKKEWPASVATLTDVVRINARLDQLAVELNEEYETAQILAGFT